MPRKIISLDATTFNTYELCHRRCFFNFVCNCHPMIKEDYFDRGDLLHYLLRIHYKILRHNFNFSAPTPDTPGRTVPYPEIIKISTRKGEAYALNMDLQGEEVLRTIETYKEYAKYYEGENWIPEFIEQPFSKVMYEDDDLTILWEGLIDLMVKQGIVDTKSSERRGEPSALSYQFMGYCWAFGVHNLIINKVGFQKTLSPKDKFERYTKSYPPAILEEFRNHVVNTVKAELLPDLENAKPMKLEGSMYEKFNYTSCDKFSSCRYSKVCNTEPELRLWKLQTDFKIGEEWRPTKSLESQLTK